MLFYFVLKIVDGVASIDVRRKFIAALAPLFGRPVEADPVRILVYSLLYGWIKQKADYLCYACQVFCRKATFLGSSGVFTFLVGYRFLFTGGL